jgi:hypothetical protein
VRKFVLVLHAERRRPLVLVHSKHVQEKPPWLRSLGNGSKLRCAR